MKPLFDCRLYAFVDSAYLNGREPADIARALCDGGSDLIQLRAKDAPVDEVERMAEVILPITREAGVRLVINDHWDLANRLGADICHLGQEDFFDAGHANKSDLGARVRDPQQQPIGDGPEPVRGQDDALRRCGSQTRGPETPAARDSNLSTHNSLARRSEAKAAQPSTLLGLSTHAPEQAERAIAAEADYIAIGPVYATGTKPTAKPVTLEYVSWAAEHVKIPWFSIGGINLSNIDEVLEAGARRICVVSAILNAPDIARACQEYRDRLSSAPL